MKITLKTLVLLLAFASTVIITGCGGGSDPEPSVEDQQLKKLSATWAVSSVTLDTSDKTSDYTSTSFKLTITGTAGADSFGYSTSGRPTTSPWPSSGTWAFLDTDPEHTIIRDELTSDPISIDYVISSDGNTLQLTFDFNNTGYQNTSRTSQVTGEWVFTFTKQ